MRGYICSYTARGVQSGNGMGILAIDFDPVRGWIEAGHTCPGDSPSWLVMAPDGRHAYAVNEVADWNGSDQGGVTAYRVADDGNLRALNTVASGGTDPHIAACIQCTGSCSSPITAADSSVSCRSSLTVLWARRQISSRLRVNLDQLSHHTRRTEVSHAADMMAPMRI